MSLDWGYLVCLSLKIIYNIEMAKLYENFGEPENEKEAMREQMELLENILDTNKIIVRLRRLLKTQSELFEEEISILGKLLKIFEKYQIIFESSGIKEDPESLAPKESIVAIEKLPEDEDLDDEIYQEIHRQVNVAQQIIDAEQITKRCDKIISNGKIAVEDEREILKALKILDNFKKILKS